MTHRCYCPHYEHTYPTVLATFEAALEALLKSIFTRSDQNMVNTTAKHYVLKGHKTSPVGPTSAASPIWHHVTLVSQSQVSMRGKGAQAMPDIRPMKNVKEGVQN